MSWSKIRELMRDLGLRQYQLAQKLGVSDSHLSTAIRDDRDGELRDRAEVILNQVRAERLKQWQPDE